MPLAVALHDLTDADPDQAAFVRRAVGLLGEALAEPDFLVAVAAADYTATRWQPAQGPARNFTPAQIATRIGEGRERGGDADQRIDLTLELADLPSPETGKKVLGATNLGQTPIRPARWFVDMCRAAPGADKRGTGDAVNFASHLMHEWCHLSGFTHWPDNKARGDTAYVVGRLVRETLEARHGAEIDPAITEMMHDVETDCGCRGNGD